MAAQANRTRGARHRVVSRAKLPLLHRAALRFRDGTLVPPSGTAIAQDGLATRQTGQLSPHPYHRHMLLVIDVGNTNLTLGVVEAGLIVSVRRAATPRAGTADEVELLVSGLLALDGRTLAAVERVAIASVVPVATAAVEAATARLHIPTIIASAATVPIGCRVDRPDEVGADRLINTLAAGRLYGTPAIVVDFGTATTFDCVAPDGAYVGGAIAPGLALGLEALATKTAKLPRVELRAPERAIGTNTVSAIQSGAVLGYQALATGLLARIRAELAAAEHVAPATIKTVLTGGLSAAPWARGIEGVDIVDPDLTLKGLAMLAVTAEAAL